MMKTISAPLVVCAGIVLAALLLGSASSYPVHASCKLTWTVNKNCSAVSMMLTSQMKKWNMNTESYCTQTGSEKCLYDLKTVTANEITATHTTPVHHYVDEFSFELSDAGTSCTIKGNSSSKIWYAVLDSGTNYCNMRNLADGSGLSQDPSFKEVASDSNCTQYSSHNCDKY